MKARPLKIPFAIRAGQLVHISDVENGLQPDCTCPACKSPLVARKGSLKVHHFAHAAESNCQPETVMHLLGKQLLAETIDAAIREGVPLWLSWNCEDCRDSHAIDLTQNIAQVAVEHAPPPFAPVLVLGYMRPHCERDHLHQFPVHHGSHGRNGEGERESDGRDQQSF